jgi:hypothetical protein
MLSHARFGNLRLSQFVPASGIVDLSGWEFMDTVWVGEAVGFSEWLRLESDPNVLRSLALDLLEFPEAAASEVLRVIDLPVRRGMAAEELRELFGEPVTEPRIAADRATYEFDFFGPPRYMLSFTVLNQGGLAYLVVMRPAPTSFSAGC